MPNFTNQTPASTYPCILTIGSLSQVGLTNVLSQVQDAYGTGTNLSLSTLGFNIARSGYFFSLDSVNITAEGADINSMCQPNPIVLGTGSITVARGTTAQRPGSPVNGMIRYNTSIDELEAYEANVWTPIATGSVGTVTSVAAAVSGVGMSITGSPITTSGTFTFTLSGELQGLSQLVGTGIVAHTAVNTYAARTITGTSNRISVNDGDGVLGNPTIDIAATYVGQTSITTLGTVTAGTWNASVIGLAYGGTNANLTASNGGIVWSNATQLQILSGTATANQVLLSGSAATPAWSTATYPATSTINQLLYSSSNNVITGLATTNRASLSTDATGVPTWLALEDGEVVIGSTAGTPAAATLTAGAGISIVNGSNTITITNTGSGANWVDQTTTPVSLAVNTSYVANNAGLVTFEMPATVAFGSVFEIRGQGAGGWLVQFNAGQTGHLSSASTTVGGSFASTNRYDVISIVCTVADTTFVCTATGSITDA